jgi:2-hydroxychromene-2-carboxylate isomerase
MGDLILLTERASDRTRATATSRIAFFFDLACPFSYLAAERVERLFGDVEWVPASSPWPVDPSAVVERAERRAAELRLSISWPDPFPTDCTGAMRAAAFAAENGAGGRFALAALRLAFCGGFDLADPELITAAAEASGLNTDACLDAMCDDARDIALAATGRNLPRRGVRSLPAIRVGRHWFDGERGIEEASTLLRARAVLAPAG